MNNKNKQKGKNDSPTNRPIRARGKTKRVRQDDEKVSKKRRQDRNNSSRGHRRNVSRSETRNQEQIKKEKEIMNILIDERPKLFVFELPDEDIEINAMDFKDACLTLEEQAPDIKIRDIISIQEIHSPIPGHDTIH